MRYDEDALENLRQAVIRQAVSDYKRVLKKLRSNPDSVTLQTEKRTMEEDFRQHYFLILAGIDDGDEFASMIRESIDRKRSNPKLNYGRKRRQRRERR